MSTDESVRAGFLLQRWIVANFLGWMMGFVLVIGLAVLSDLMGGTVQFIVGVGMGAGVGYMQGRFLRPWVDSVGLWVLSSTVGLAAPFALWDVATPLGFGSLFSLPVCAAVGGLVTGVLQWLWLRRSSSRAVWWVPVSLVGWALPVGLIALRDLDVVPSQWGEMLSLGAMFFGGALLGVVTAKPLRWITSSAAV
jgi:hypothetical protein